MFLTLYSWEERLINNFSPIYLTEKQNQSKIQSGTQFINEILASVNTRPTFHTLLKSIPNPYFDWSAWIFRPSWSDCQSSLHICVTWEANKKFAAGEKHVGTGQKGRRRPAWIHYSLVEFLPQNGPHGVDLDLTNFGRTFSVSRGRGSTHKSNSINYHSQVLGEHRGDVSLVRGQLEDVKPEASDGIDHACMLTSGLFDVDGGVWLRKKEKLFETKKKFAHVPIIEGKFCSIFFYMWRYKCNQI